MRWEAQESGFGPCTPTAAQQTMLKETLAALGTSPLLALTHTQDDERAILAQAARWSGCERIVIIGTGGASLGGQVLAALAPQRERVCFLDNVDPESAAHLLSGRDITRIGWIIISKSGRTVETLATLLAVLERYRIAGCAEAFSAHALIITGDTQSPLAELGSALSIPCFAHPAIGGRYSVLSAVGGVPATLAGLAVEDLRAGARGWWEAASTPGPAQEALLRHVVWLVEGMATHPLHVVMPYSDVLRPYTRWFQQLWAESLGKQGKGSTPFAALGTIDQHSQLQLFLDGPRDKSFTLVLPRLGAGAMRLADSPLASLSYLAGHDLGDVMDASAQAIATTLAAQNVPLRILRAGKLDAGALGELLLRHMVETVLAAALLGVDPYDQPAVEEGKRLTRAYLEGAA